MAKGLCYKRRKSIGKTPPQPIPPGIDWDLFLGPAPMREFTMNRFKYNWHWFWDTGNGDIGNQGVHEMDLARWGLGDIGFPKSVVSTGGKYVYDDDQETPNTQMSSFLYDGLEIVFEVRGLITGGEGNITNLFGPVGNLFYGSEGWMRVDYGSFAIYKGEKSEKTLEEKADKDEGVMAHIGNFLECCRSRDNTKLHAEVEIGATSAAFCHLANISYRTGRRLEWDDAARRFVGAPDADLLLTRPYRKPYVV
jgi:predicted dehydrogenase